MADVKWIKIATDIFDNRKIEQIEALPEGDSIIVIWFKLLCLAADVNDSGQVYLTKDVPYTDTMLAVAFDRPLITVQMALSTFEQFHMIEIVENIIHVANWDKYQNVEGMERVREQTRKRVAEYRAKKALEKKEECNVTSNATVTQSSYSYSISNSNIDNYKLLEIDSEVKQYIAENDVFANAIIDWLAYKDEKKPKKENHYTAAGMKKWIKQMFNGCKEYGVQQVVDAINYAIAHEWKGVYFDNLKKNNKPSGIEGIEDW